MRQEAINTIRKREAWTKKRAAQSRKFIAEYDAGEARDRRLIDRVQRDLPMFTCPVCSSRWVQFMKRKKGFYCRHCGHEWPKEEAPAERKARK